jgi:hypothetical protein
MISGSNRLCAAISSSRRDALPFVVRWAFGRPDTHSTSFEKGKAMRLAKRWAKANSRVPAVILRLSQCLAAVTAIAAFSFCTGAAAQTTHEATTAPAENAAGPTADNAVMLTVFFKHDQSRPLGELNAQLDRQGFYKAFPPAGIEVVSWYVMMGIGQVVTLRLPASRLREVNRILENTAWGSYHTEFYPTYDYKPVGLASHEKAQAKQDADRDSPGGARP